MKKELLYRIGLFVLLCNIVLLPNAHANTSFSDVSKSDWLYHEIHFLNDKGIVKGFSDGSFKPNESITRLQAVTMILRAKGIEEITDVSNPHFADVQQGDIGYEMIAKAYELGIISGKVNSKGEMIFDANGKLTRTQMAKILSMSFGLTGTSNKTFSDVPKNHWGYVYIQALANHKITFGYTDGRFGVNDNITRGQFAAMLARTLDESFRIEPTNQVVKNSNIEDFKKLLNGWKVSAVGSTDYKNTQYIFFEKDEYLGGKWTANQLSINKWEENEASFSNDVNNFIQQLKDLQIEHTIIEYTSNVFYASNTNGLEYVIDYIVKKDNGYIVYEIRLQRFNEGWRYGVDENEMLYQNTINEVKTKASGLIEKFNGFQFEDNDRDIEIMFSQPEWSLYSTRITGNANLEFMPNGWTRLFKKESEFGDYELEINKTVISKEKYAYLLNLYKNTTTLTNSSNNVKAYRSDLTISVIDDESYGRSGDNRLVFVTKEGSSTVDFYKIYFDTPIYYYVDGWNETDKNEADKTFNFVINHLIQANR